MKIEKGMVYRFRTSGFPYKYVFDITYRDGLDPQGVPYRVIQYIYVKPVDPKGHLRTLQHWSEKWFRDRALEGPLTMDDVRRRFSREERVQ